MTHLAGHLKPATGPFNGGSKLGVQHNVMCAKCSVYHTYQHHPLPGILRRPPGHHAVPRRHHRRPFPAYAITESPPAPSPPISTVQPAVHPIHFLPRHFLPGLLQGWERWWKLDYVEKKELEHNKMKEALSPVRLATRLWAVMSPPLNVLMGAIVFMVIVPSKAVLANPVFDVGQA